LGSVAGKGDASCCPRCRRIFVEELKEGVLFFSPLVGGLLREASLHFSTRVPFHFFERVGCRFFSRRGMSGVEQLARVADLPPVGERTLDVVSEFALSFSTEKRISVETLNFFIGRSPD